ncbi:ABC transporter ATP-binding protein [Mycoplasmopsis columbinasalis]|uniref:ABC-type multidrug/protein/lipid transport system ATPase component n=1 Tax=Mycoplasmopsis columbinasalis TaxID=114880 RepID=A0A449B9Y2_9BACT|nr:ABC transporter ATP-binding protein [Mycoplasmopsis columbinasalis]VEU78000.1 ABC-type multidrug/protein/lipid transport system ATPase component [Mycoplasmopsis columbinasalis]
MLKIFKMLSTKLKWFAVLTVIFSCIQPFLSMYLPSIVKQLISISTNSEVNSINLIFWTIKTNGYNQTLTYLIIITLSIIIVFIATWFTSSYLSKKFGILAAYEIRKILFNHLIYLSQSNIEKYTSGTLLTRFTNDISKLQDGLSTIFRDFFVSILLCVWGIVFAVLTNIYFSITLLVVIPLTILGSFFIIKKLFPLYRKENYSLDAINDVAKEDVSAITLIKSYNLENTRYQNFLAKAQNNYNIGKKANLLGGTAWPLIDLISALGTSLLFIIVGFLIKNQMTDAQMNLVGNIYQFTSYFGSVSGAVSWTMFASNRVVRAKPTAQRFLEIFNEQPAIPMNKDGKIVNNISITFENVSFAYPTQEANKVPRQVLKNLSFKIQSGQSIGIIGKTGSGKSTLIKLIAREYALEPGQGRILIDNVDLAEVNLDDYYSKLSIILQKSKVLSGTILENITFRNSHYTEADVREVVDIANCDYIYEFKEQFDYPLGQKGKNLSGGQQQRLSITQGLSKNLKLFVLDDSSSALDNKTDFEIRNKLRNYYKDTTMLIIAQRIGSIKHCDKILILDQGELVGFDTHENLLANNPYYQKIYESQNKKELNA